MNEIVIWKTDDGQTHRATLQGGGQAPDGPSVFTDCGLTIHDPQGRPEPEDAEITCPDCRARFVIVV